MSAARTENYHFDRIMSLHRRAYAIHAEGGTLEDWLKLADQLKLRQDAQIQFFQTAHTAYTSGMTARKAFPLSGELAEALAEIEAGKGEAGD